MKLSPTGPVTVKSKLSSKISVFLIICKLPGALLVNVHTTVSSSPTSMPLILLLAICGVPRGMPPGLVSHEASTKVQESGLGKFSVPDQQTICLINR